LIYFSPKNSAQLLQIKSAFKTNQVYKVENTVKDDIFKQIILLLRQRSGVDFTYYKQQTPTGG
jgi:two-component system CheB/CheR fusion protein